MRNADDGLADLEECGTFFSIRKVEKREYDRAVEQYRRTLEMYPSFLAAHVGIGRAYEQKGMYREALAELQEVQKKSGAKGLPPAAAYTYAVSGRRAEARKILDGMMAEAGRLGGNH